MDGRVEVVLFEHLSEGFAVAAVDLNERNLDARDFANALDGTHLGVGEIVRDHDVVTGGDQLHGGVGTDVSGTSRYQYALFFHGLYGI